jgi:predicted nucleotidyltransferase
MHPLVDTKRAQLVALCRNRGVKRLELFGSAARDDFDAERSDLDFLVDLGDDPCTSPLDAYFGLKDELEALFNRPVDLVSDGSIRNPYVLASIQRDKRLLYPA